MSLKKVFDFCKSLLSDLIEDSWILASASSFHLLGEHMPSSLRKLHRTRESSLC